MLQHTYNDFQDRQRSTSGIFVYQVRDNHARTTRSGNDFVLPRFTKTSTQNSLFFKGAKLYNELQTIIRQNNNLANEEMTITIV
jgi:hypothetical protein